MKYDLLERVVVELDPLTQVYAEATVLGRTHFAPRLQREPEYLVQYQLEGENCLLWYTESSLHN